MLKNWISKLLNSAACQIKCATCRHKWKRVPTEEQLEWQRECEEVQKIRGGCYTYSVDAECIKCGKKVTQYSDWMC